MNSKKYKFPRIFHVPWSPNLQNDDRKHPDMSVFAGKNVVVTIKMDGENTTWYKDVIHARSIDSQNANHTSRDFVKNMWAQRKYLITDGRRICGENLYAEHSIKYADLDSYFYVFSIWHDDICLSWDDTKKICEELDLTTVPVIYEGIYDVDKIKTIFQNYDFNEGYVIRIADTFAHDFDSETFLNPIAKFVRENHVQTDKHWLKTWDKTKINKLKD
jgi:hypothetical protein